MRRTNRSGGFWLCLLINIVLNFEGAIPGVILLVCYFVFGIPWWLSVIAFAIWIIGIMIWMFVIGWAGSCSSSVRPTTNKNPYSGGQNQNRNPYSRVGMRNDAQIKPQNDDRFKPRDETGFRPKSDTGFQPKKPNNK